MPTLNLYTNVPVDAVTTSDILKDATKAVAKIIGKPESYVMILVNGGVPMAFAGTEAPAAYGELISIGGLGPSVNAKLSSTVADILQTKLSIDNSRFYIKFYDVQIKINKRYAGSANWTVKLPRYGLEVGLTNYAAEKYQSPFSEYIKRGIEADNIQSLYKKVHAAIRADPTAKKTEKEPHKQHKRFNLKKLTYEERKAKLRLHTLNAAAGADSEEED
ncbi:hypothetical protein J1N35_018296 [Gossypium stocksii]|uniref:L-dopachrome isomerase n=1 Tax=Gossypium stocksii TaxID=47602 RepID=A0A9D3VP10_9ROSI|nr:hypothetical protein J1N35_018296 [Gossypium stocksii]